MICNAKSCSIFGSWTLQDATVEIQTGSTPAAPPATAPSAPKKPKRAESPAALVPNVAKLSSTAKPVEVKRGETFTYQVTIKLDSGFHVYTYDDDPAPASRPGTRFDFFDTADFKVAGNWTTESPIEVKESSLNLGEFEKYHEGTVTWSLPLTVPADAAPGNHTLRCQVSFQVCDATSCRPEARVNLPEVIVGVIDQTAATDPNTNSKATAPAPTAEARTGMPRSRLSGAPRPSNRWLDEKDKPASKTSNT